MSHGTASRNGTVPSNGKPGGGPIPAADKALQEQISPAARRFLDFAEGRPELFRLATFDGLFERARALVPTLSGVEPGDSYGLQPWPVLIDAARRREFARASVALGRLVRDLPRRFFGNDPKAVAEFYGLSSEVEAALLLSPPSFVGETLGRGDFIETETGLKCIEFNFGNLGGWQHCIYAPLYLEHPEIAAFAAESGLELSFRNSIRALLRHVVRDGLRRSPPGQRELNLLVTASETGSTSRGSHPVAAYRREYAEVLRRLGGGVRGRLEVVTASEPEVVDGFLYAGGDGSNGAGGDSFPRTRFHCVIEQADTEPSQEIFRASKAGKVFCYTGLVGLVTGDKRNLALLWENRRSARFSAEERALIEHYIPWTRHLREEEASFRGDRGPMRELLLRHRRDLVLKAGRGFAGFQVHVGRFTEEAEWEQRVEEAFEEGGWLAQEYLEALPQTYQQGEDGVGAYDIVWGLYVFGDTYGGVFFRMGVRGETPVLNISQGARIGVVLEARER